MVRKFQLSVFNALKSSLILKKKKINKIKVFTKLKNLLFSIHQMNHQKNDTQKYTQYSNN